MTFDEAYPELPSSLSKEQKILLVLLKQSGVEEDALVGTMLLLKDSQQEMDDMILYIWDNEPTPEQIDEHLEQIVLARTK